MNFLDWYKLTFDQRKSPLGPEYSGTLRSIGVVQKVGRTEEAAKLHEEALEIRRRVLGPEYPDMRNIMNRLAAPYWSLGRTERGVPKAGRGDARDPEEGARTRT